MDAAVLKTLLDSQNQAFQGAIEVFMKQVNENVRSLQSTIGELRTSLEFTQKDLEDMKQELKKHQEEKKNDQEIIKKLSEDLQSRKKIINELEERVNYQEDYSRRNNLQIIGLEERQGGETWEQTAVQVTKLLESKLQLPNIQLERAHRVGRQEDHGRRPIIARFSSFVDREAVMRNTTKLRGTRIYINEDLCPASQSIRKAKLPQLKQARSEGKVAYFRHTRLIIKERSSGAVASGFPRENEQNEASTVSELHVGSMERGVGSSSGAGVEASVGDGTRTRDRATTEIRMDVSAAGAWASGMSSNTGIRPSASSPAVNKDSLERRKSEAAAQRATRNSARGGRKGQ